MDFKEVLDSKEDIYPGKKASDSEIKKAEEQLQLKFSDEYVEYLKEFGDLSYESHELTGITENNNLNVVFVTEYWRKKNSNISKEYYVIEDLKIDNVVFWQDRKGDIYQTIGNEVPKKMYESLLEYIKST
jgi:hypothetical protein